MRARRAVAGAVAAGAAVFATGCTSAATPRPPAVRHGSPDIAGFLQLPVASPRSCPPTVNGTTAGRRSPWVGAVDVSVFLARSDATTVTSLRRALAALPGVVTVFYESPAQAYAEFQRLYTCSDGVPATSVPASFRLVLSGSVHLPERDALVRGILALPGVATASCDPSSPCVDVVRSDAPSAGAPSARASAARS